MRLSTNTIYAMGTQSILNQQSKVAKIGEQLASERRIVSPADDPGGATQALTVSHAIAVNQQYAANRSTADQHLSAEENQLNTATDALTAAKPLLVQALNGTLSDADRASVTTQLQGVYEQLLSSANAQDGNGRYIFSGFASTTPPFSGSAGNVTYQGDSGQRQLPVDGSQQIAINDSGAAIFGAVTANAKYIGSADKTNAGTGVIDQLTTTDASAADYGHKFKLSFQNKAGQLRYTVVDEKTGSKVHGDFKVGQPIALGGGQSVTISGKPADGDQFTFGRGLAKDNNILNTLADVVSQLRKPTAGNPRAQAALTNTLNAADRKLDNALDNVLEVRASVGSRRNQLDTLNTAGANQQLNNKTNLSNIQDLDQVSAISDYSLAKVALQLSEQTFGQVQKMSLFGVG